MALAGKNIVIGIILILVGVVCLASLVWSYGINSYPFASKDYTTLALSAVALYFGYRQLTKKSTA